MWDGVNSAKTTWIILEKPNQKIGESLEDAVNFPSFSLTNHPFFFLRSKRCRGGGLQRVWTEQSSTFGSGRSAGSPTEASRIASPLLRYSFSKTQFSLCLFVCLFLFSFWVREVGVVVWFLGFKIGAFWFPQYGKPNSWFGFLIANFVRWCRVLLIRLLCCEEEWSCLLIMFVIC